jgi:hypothetical protein
VIYNVLNVLITNVLKKHLAQMLVARQMEMHFNVLVIVVQGLRRALLFVIPLIVKHVLDPKFAQSIPVY